MGEIADMMLDGTMDPETGEFNFDGEDGPGFPMTAAEADEFKRATGWRGHDGPSEHRGKPLFGFWRAIALEVKMGANTHQKLADALPGQGRAVSSQIKHMVRAGFLTWSGRLLVLTGKAEADLADQSG